MLVPYLLKKRVVTTAPGKWLFYNQNKTESDKRTDQPKRFLVSELSLPMCTNTDERSRSDTPAATD